MLLLLPLLLPRRYVVTDGVGRIGMDEAMTILSAFMKSRTVRSSKFALACQVADCVEVGVWVYSLWV
jgi:hypothetical protein